MTHTISDYPGGTTCEPHVFLACPPGSVGILQTRLEALERLEQGIKELLATYKVADEERLKETQEAYDEAMKWKAEGDMYGYNFHVGKSGGITGASLFFYRVKKKLNELLGVKP